MEAGAFDDVDCALMAHAMASELYRIPLVVEPGTYALTASERMSGPEISESLGPAGLDLAGDIGDVTFAGPCIVRGKISGHIVVQGETAPVTVFLIKEQLVANRATIHSDHYSGVVIPQGTGTIAIVSAPGESIEQVEAQVRSAVRWSATRGA